MLNNTHSLGGICNCGNFHNLSFPLFRSTPTFSATKAMTAKQLEKICLLLLLFVYAIDKDAEGQKDKLAWVTHGNHDIMSCVDLHAVLCCVSAVWRAPAPSSNDAMENVNTVSRSRPDLYYVFCPVSMQSVKALQEDSSRRVANRAEASTPYSLPSAWAVLLEDQITYSYLHKLSHF